MYTKLKTLLIAMTLAGFASQHAVAEKFNHEDMAFVFGDSIAVNFNSGQMDLLSSQEMIATEGEYWLFYYGGGALLGMAGYGAGCIYSGCSARGFGYAALAGAMSPTRAGTTFVANYYRNTAIGTGWGVGSYNGWW